MPQLRSLLVAVALIFTAGLSPTAATAADSPDARFASPPADLAYDVPFFPGAVYDPAIPTQEELLGFPAGGRAARPAEIEKAFMAWAEASPRATLTEYARSWEGRPLYYLVITSPANHQRLEEIKDGWAEVADPREVEAAEAERLAAELPAVAWLGYSIHGDETSGADGALATAYHLVAGTGPEVTGLLEELVVILDPMMNPDGRDRFLQMVAEHRSGQPNVDDQSLLHTGYWPWGRGNHYLFDLNRDWVLGVHPETRGRIRAAAAWHPLLFVDAHEMGSQDSFLFYPPRPAINPHIPEHVVEWWQRFGRDQAAAFDLRGWRYYTGEWSENWYPGYSDAWGSYRGAIGILYEQARYAEDGVMKATGQVETYREAVHHQAVSSLANLETLRANRQRIAADYLAARRQAVAADGPYADRTFALPPTANRGRLATFVDKLELQGFELYELAQEWTVEGAVDSLGRSARRTLPAGTLLIPNRQPEARLLAVMLERDIRLPADYVERDRRELLARGRGLSYDVTAWSLPLLYGLDAYTVPAEPPASARPWSGLAAPEPAADEGSTAPPVAWVVDGRDDNSVALAARLMEQGLRLRLAEKDFELDERRWPRGSLLILADDNRGHEAGELAAKVAAEVEPLGLTVWPLSTGFGEGELPDLGGRYFDLLQRPRVAIVSRGWTDTTDYGSLWLTLDRHLGIRHSHLENELLGFTDLRRYNVLVMPSRWFGELGEETKKNVERWVEAGGTLIAMDATASALAAEEGLSRVRQLPDVLEELDAYRTPLLREWEARWGELEPEKVWAQRLEGEPTYPWQGSAKIEDPPAEELKRRDTWEQIFMPSGALVAGRIDDEHWLTAGVSEPLPLLVGRIPVLMAPAGVDAVVRVGYLAERDGPPASEARRAGWAPLPPDRDLYLRMSGLVYPEAAHRLAHAAYLTRERKGNGQVILFATPPAFRGTTLATRRLFTNAVVYGPGLGAEAPIVP